MIYCRQINQTDHDLSVRPRWRRCTCTAACALTLKRLGRPHLTFTCRCYRGPEGSRSRLRLPPKQIPGSQEGGEFFYSVVFFMQMDTPARNPRTCVLVGTKFPSISYGLGVFVRSVSVCVTVTRAKAAALSRGDAALSIYIVFLGAPEPRIALVGRPPIGTSPVRPVRVS